MDSEKPDIHADILPDLGESVSLMEPLLLPSDCSARQELSDLCVDLAAKSAALRNKVPPALLTSLADLVRAMNCYYSNLIEGHDTHPVEIERALRGDYSNDPAKRNLQLEAKAHISVQQWIDSGAITGGALDLANLCEIHKRFCAEIPDELLWVEGPGGKDKVIPGQFRQRLVQVGKHVAVSPGAIPRFLTRFDSAYGRLGKLEKILALPAAHHRFLWIHPFLDGNGRVARLISYAQLLELVDTGGVWSIARGMARNVNAYKQHLMSCDEQRRNDYDGRGNLSQIALEQFTQFFLEACLDQVAFMETLVQPDKLRNRIIVWVEQESKTDRLLANAGRILEAILYRGELPRAEVPLLLGVGERQARRVVSALSTRGVLTSPSDRSPLRLAFPAALAPYWMPGLFP
jgi:Fic family protein